MNNTKSTKRTLVTSILSLVLCMAMLVGTTFAWFTDNVTSTGNIIKSGTLKVQMDWAEGDEDPETATWKDASTGAIFNSELWEPGYTEAKHIKVSNVGTLALRYQMRILANGVVSELADVIDVYYLEEAEQLSRANVATKGEKLGTLSEVLNNQNTNAISKRIAGNLTAKGTENSSKTITIALHMQESAGNEYQGLSIGTDFSIQLLATQYTSESDSFDNTYDAGAEFAAQEKPSAMVSALSGDELNVTIHQMGDYKLNAGYQFEPTETVEQAQASEYRYWHADFVVSANQDVAAKSIALAGYYSLYCDNVSGINGNWIGMTSDQPIKQGTSVRLITPNPDNGTNGNQGVLSVNYEELCNYGNDGTGFQCGIVGLNDSVAGTTVTVELRLFETYSEEECLEKFGYKSTNVETGNSIPVGTFKYTFPAKEVNGQSELDDALANGVNAVELAAGNYKMPSSNTTGSISISGSKDAVVDVTKGAYLESASVSIEGVTIKTSTGYVMDENGNKGSDYAALYSPNATYTNCTFVGPMRVGRDGAKFINCTFTDLGNDYVWTYGNDVTFEGCTFNTAGKAILIYSDGGNEISKVSVKDCTFNATTGAKAGAIANQNCAAIEIHNYGNGVALTTSGNNIGENFSGEWRIKTYETGKPGITVNGVTYTTIAIDGKTMTIDANKNVTVNN